jgi:hypothetical protein
MSLDPRTQAYPAFTVNVTPSALLAVATAQQGGVGWD